MKRPAVGLNPLHSQLYGSRDMMLTQTRWGMPFQSLSCFCFPSLSLFTTREWICLLLSLKKQKFLVAWLSCLSRVLLLFNFEYLVWSKNWIAFLRRDNRFDKKSWIYYFPISLFYCLMKVAPQPHPIPLMQEQHMGLSRCPMVILPKKKRERWKSTFPILALIILEKKLLFNYI